MFRKQLEKVTRSRRTTNVTRHGVRGLADIRDIFNFLSKTYFSAYRHVQFNGGEWVKIKDIDKTLINEGYILINDKFILSKDGKVDGTMKITGLALATIVEHNTLFVGYPEQYSESRGGDGDLVILKNEECLVNTVRDLGLVYDPKLGNNAGTCITECLDNVSYVQFEVPQIQIESRRTPFPRTRIVTYAIGLKELKFCKYGKASHVLPNLPHNKVSR